jgi:CheY-like chemotaxis protein
VNDKHGRTLCGCGIGNAGFVSMVMNKAVSGLGKNILLVDDDPQARESIRLLLNIDRHIVTEAASGLEALQLFTSRAFDLVITDYLMPGMLGDKLAESIREIAPKQPILMVTAYVEKLIAAGQPADSMLGKPWSVEELRRAVAEKARR